MKFIDIIFALICGRIVAWVAADFIKDYGMEISFAWRIFLNYVLPAVAVICLYVAFLIGKKFIFVFQGAKYLLVGAAATVLDLQIFTLLLFLLPGAGAFYASALKGASFVVSTFAKYWGNKFWAFTTPERENIFQEMVKFFAVTSVGLAIDVLCFIYLTKFFEPQFTMPGGLWVKSSVILSAVAAAIWNFLGYKFLVFKK